MATMIPERQVEAVRFSTDIVDVISACIPLKRSGSTYKACCPFHQEKTPSFHVNPARQSYKCFGCGEYGDCFTFLMKHQGLTFVEAVKMLAERAHIALDMKADDGEGERRKTLYAINHGVAGFYRRCLQQLDSAGPARRYLAERAIDDTVAEEFGIGYAPAIWNATLQWAAKHGYTEDQLIEAGVLVKPGPERPGKHAYDRFRNRLMFPIRDAQERVVAFSGRLLDSAAKAAKYVNSPETPVFHKGRVLYALDKARTHILRDPAREAVICEGQIDVIRCHAAGVRTAVAAQGTAFTDDHVTLLKRYADAVVIVFDSDSAGQDAAVKTARLFLQAGIVPRIARLPAGEDPDSFIRDKGAAAFREQLASAASAIAFAYTVLAEREPDPRELAAISRISRELLATIAGCDNAVLRARMLQEAADKVSLPVDALNAELRAVEAAAPGRSGRRPPPAVAGVTRPDQVRLDGTPAALSSPAAGRVELDLCEQLLRAEHEPEAAALVRHYVPLDLLRDETCRELIDLMLRAASEGLGLHEALGIYGASENARVLAETCIEGADRIVHREFTRLDAIRDLIRNLWSRKLDAEIQALTRVPIQTRTVEQRNRLTDIRVHKREIQSGEWTAVGELLQWLVAASA